MTGVNMPGLDKMMKAMTSVDGLAYLTVMDMTVEGTGQMADMMRQMMGGDEGHHARLTSLSAEAIGDDQFKVPDGLHHRQVARPRQRTIIGGMKHIACAVLAAASLSRVPVRTNPPGAASRRSRLRRCPAS